MSQGVECYSCLPKTAWPPTSGFIRLCPEGESEYADLLRSGPAGQPHVHETPPDEADGIGTCEEALAIALREEQSCIEQYSTLVDAIRDPEMHAMFCKALKDTEQHLKAIEAEYARNMGSAGPARDCI